MKILTITASYKPAYVYGGPVMSVAKLCEQTNQSPNFENEVFTTLANGSSELHFKSGRWQRIDGVNVKFFHRVTGDHSHFSPSLISAVWKNCKTYDIIHLHAWWNLVTMLSCTICILRGCKVVLSPRGTLSKYSFYNRNRRIKNLFHKMIGKPLLKRCFYHLTSSYELNDLHGFVPRQRIFIRPNFVLLPDSLAARPPSKKSLTLIFLSRIEQKKNLEFLFKVLSKCKPGWQLSIAGSGDPNYVRQLQDLAVSLFIDDYIFWLGHLGNDKKFGELQRHDYLVLPSFDENFANVVVESLYAGTPVILSDRVGLYDYVRNNDVGEVLPLQPTLWIHLLESLMTNKKDYQIDPASIYNDFNGQNLTKLYHQMYESI